MAASLVPRLALPLPLRRRKDITGANRTLELPGVLEAMPRIYVSTQYIPDTQVGRDGAAYCRPAVLLSSAALSACGRPARSTHVPGAEVCVGDGHI